ncbi:MAG: peptidoglycan-binding protein [Alphaproteobacteria bacterium]|nr:MAG: peptidoglycan-binding protein [Alphaproteobacteria bacterium]
MAPLPLLAEDTALVIVENDYWRLPDRPDGREMGAVIDTLEAQGFRVLSSVDQDAAAVTQTMQAFRAISDSADRLFVLISGHIVSTGRESWLLTRFAEAPNDITIGAQGVPIGPVLDIAARHPGQAVVMLSPSGDAFGGEGLSPGFDLAAPQGVAIFSGAPRDIARFARDRLLVPGRALGRVPDGIEARGFIAEKLAFLPGVPEVTPPAGGPAGNVEVALWKIVRSLGTPEAYKAYLGAFPNGQFVPIARAKLRDLEGAAASGPEAAEAALGLDRETRRLIQRNLSILGYDPRGIDGIFGPGSRAAIAAWQRDHGYPATGYFTAGQLRALNDAAAVRAAELEREAAARKAEEERRDTAYWRDTGRGATEAGIRAYLERYPDGLYSDIARARLAEIEDQKRQAAAAEERAYWDDVRRKDTVEAYRQYLRRYPRGSFVDEAKARIAELTAATGTNAAQAEEQQVAGNLVTRLLVERRLAAAGYDPGPIDGTFDKKTRKAIRRFQRSAGLEVSGYVTRETLVRLLTVR